MWRSTLLVAAAIGVVASSAGCARLEPDGTAASNDGSPGGNSDNGTSSGSGSGGSASGGATGTSSGGPSGSGGSSGATRDSSAGGTDGGRPGDASAPPMRGPEPPANGTNFPFPQNRQASRCTYPTAYRNEDVQAAYAQWKTDTVTSSGAGNFRRVQRTPSDQGLAMGSTVSEGIGYGMLIAVYMGDQSLFDDLWQYEQLHLGQCPPNGACPAMQLMDWYISADGSQALGTGAATDADEDMAFALVMADKQWGGQGKLSRSYRQFAIDQITAIWVLEVYQSMLMKPGTWGDNNTLNISYFAPAYYRVFKAVGGTLPKPDGGGNWNPNWDQTIDGSYTTISNALNAASGNQNNGLVPAWCNSMGVPNAGAINPGGNATNYQYDSCRTPFRIALDWCWNGETRAQAYVAKTSSFFSTIGASNIADGYALDGAAQPAHAGALSAAFIGPAGVGAMSSSSYQSFLDSAYGEVATHNLLAGGAYYEDSWTVMSLLMMTANFLDYTMY